MGHVILHLLDAEAVFFYINSQVRAIRLGQTGQGGLYIMNTQSTIAPDKFADTGRALYGERWQTSLAVDLRVADRTIRRWLTGEVPIPSNIENELRELIKKRMNEMGGIIGFEVVPSNRTIFHYNTFACYIYDEAENVTLLNQPVGIAPTDVALLTQGAQEALRQENERNQRGIKAGWVDPQTGRYASPTS
jgi:hypothetical protein